MVDGALHAQGASLEGPLIIGADGVGSAVRDAVVPGVAPRPAGYGAWRAVAQTGEKTPSRASETMGRGKRFGIAPLRGGRTYWFAVPSRDDGNDELEEEFADWHQPIPELLTMTPATERSYLPLYDLAPLPTWHCGNIVLIGDAAHATTPNLGQGAAQALEDVAVLASSLRDRPLTAALDAFERCRKRRAESIVRQSRAMGRVAQAANPAVAGLRDLFARHTPTAIAAHQLARVLDSPVLPPSSTQTVEAG